MLSNNTTTTSSFYKIVFTGGPCGGKSTAQAVLSDALENAGWRVFKMSEVATFVLSGGVVFSKLSKDEAFKFQENLLSSIMAVEKVYEDLARSMASRESCNVALLCDRGTLDTSAFLESRNQWLEILDRIGTNEIEIRDQSYDLVIHMASAANGAEKFYSKENNCVRSENIELARKLDNALKTAWMGHPYFYLIDNSTGFDEKLHRVVSTVLSHLGIADRRGGKQISKLKFLIPSLPKDKDFSPVPFRDFEVEHDYLISPDSTIQTRIRKRGRNGTFAYTLTMKRPEENGQIIQVRRSLTSREYEALMTQADPKRETIVKARRCFVWNDLFYQIDDYKSPMKNLTLLEVFVPTTPTTAETKLSDFIPPFVSSLGPCIDVTGELKYSMFSLSLRN